MKRENVSVLRAENRSMVCVQMCVTRKCLLFFVRANWDCRYWHNQATSPNTRAANIAKGVISIQWLIQIGFSTALNNDMGWEKSLQTVQTSGNMHSIHCVQIFTQICKIIGNDDSWGSSWVAWRRHKLTPFWPRWCEMRPNPKYRSLIQTFYPPANIHFWELRVPDFIPWLPEGKLVQPSFEKNPSF